MVNQRDVAKLAGVSSATVSAVINKNKFVSKDLKKRVLKAIKELNYEVNAIARSLKKKKTDTIGLIVGNVLSGFYSVIAKSIEDTLKKYGYSMILCNGDDDPAEELKYLKVLKSNRVDGIILTPTGKNVDFIKQYLSEKKNIVLIDRLIKGVNCDSILVDNRSSSYKAVKHLIDNGFKRIAIICGYIDRTTGRERLNGYLKAIKETGLPEENDLIKIGTFKKRAGINFTEELLGLKDRPDAIYCTNLDIALGAIQVLKKNNIKIPGEIGFMIFDDPDWSTFIDPPISCVSQPVYGMGREAAELLIKRINGQNNESGKKIKYEHLILETELKIRKSSIRKQER